VKAVGLFSEPAEPAMLRPQTLDAAYATPEELFAALGTSENGLSEQEAKQRLRENGYNQTQIYGKRSVAWLLLNNLRNPFVVLLSTLSVISFLLRNVEAGSVILVMVVVSVLLRFVQEYRSIRVINELRDLVGATATVSRIDSEGMERRQEVQMKEIVPGDIIHFSAGDMVPADVRLLSARDLFVSQSVLTGEALPQEKFEVLESRFLKQIKMSHRENQDPILLPNLCFMGTNVLSGTGTAVAVATGVQTLFAVLTRKTIRPQTRFDRGIHRVSWLLIRFMLVIVPVVLLLNGLTKGNWMQAFLFALSVAVGLTPEMLPVIVAANLTRGAVAMARRKVIVKRLSAIEEVGAMNLLCIDKTGTLTMDRIILERHLNASGEPDEEVLNYAYINSYFQTGLRNLLDAAILEHVELRETLHVANDYRKVDELPFDFSRRRMSVIVEKERQNHELICKGAVEEILEVCSWVKMGGTTIPLTPDWKQSVAKVCDEMNEEGLRVLGVAFKDIEVNKANYKYETWDESDLVLIGFVAFLDPPKESVVDALSALRREGIEVKILTGDSERVARKICHWAELEVDGVLLGHDVNHLDDYQLQEVARRTTLFAKLTPLQKARVIAALKSPETTVGFLGDGINDAAALREADVGISLDTAVDVAKESADIVLLEKNLRTLVDVVIEGRRNAANIVKYIKMAASSNFGNILTVLASSAFLTFLPILPLQLLIQNLLYDLSQITIPFDAVDEEDLVLPREWRPEGIMRFMLSLGPISSLFDLVTFGVLWWLFGANHPSDQALFQSGWFVEGLLSQTMIVYMIRTRRIPFLESRPCLALLASTLIVMGIAILLPFSGIGRLLGFVRVPLGYFGWLTVILFLYGFSIQLMKGWFISRFKTWI
jgi:P-type Mg2+ transporter